MWLLRAKLEILTKLWLDIISSGHNQILFFHLPTFDPDITFALKYDSLTDGVSLFNVKATYMGLKEKQGKREVSNKSNDKKKAWSTDKVVDKILSFLVLIACWHPLNLMNYHSVYQYSNINKELCTF